MKRLLALDAAALVAYAAAALPALTGVPAHEWLGLGLAILFAAHCALHVDWLLDALRSFARASTARRVNLVLDAALVGAVAAVTVSGLCLSGTVLQTFGLYAEGYYTWAPFHAVAAKVLLALLIVHVVVQGRRVAAWAKRDDDGGDGASR